MHFATMLETGSSSLSERQKLVDNHNWRVEFSFYLYPPDASE
jgi:hypothetical protein